MFAFFKGKVLIHKKNSSVIVNDYFGIEVYLPYFLEIGKEVSLHIYSHFSSENGTSFFGFNDIDEMDFFQLLISVPGLGAKTAIKLLHHLGINGVASSIYEQDYKMITKVPGIGSVIAKRIVTDLFDNIPKKFLHLQDSYNLFSTLIGIGYEKSSVMKIIGSVNKNLPIEEQIRESILLLQKI